MSTEPARALRSTPPKAILFDWDNTLVDSWGTIHEALNQTFRIMGTPLWSLDEVKLRVRHSLRDSFPRLFGESWEQARTLYLANFEALHLDRLMPLPGAAALVEALHESGFYLGVVSNKTGRLLRREVAALGWEPHFQRVVGAGDASADKPARAPVDLALEASGINPGAAVWFVGDTDIDMACAINSGCVPVWVGPPAEEPLAIAASPAIWFENCEALRMAVLPSSHLQYK